jgi:hypothetical protein
VANVFEMLLTGEMYSADLLKQAAVDFIRLNGSEVMRTASWRRFVRDQPRLVDYLFARLAGVPPPEQADYEDKNDANGVDDSSGRKKEESPPAGDREKVNGNATKKEEDDGGPPNKKRTL